MTAPGCWAPPPILVTTGWVLAGVAVAFAALTDDPRGRVLIALAALVLLLVAAYGTFARPRLVADATGLTVRGPISRQHFGWAEVNVRVVRTTRLGRTVSTLELDTEHRLIVLGWIDLGAHPEDVADTLLALRT